MTTTTWNIDTAHSGIHFSVRHLMLAKVRGRFTRFSGTLRTEGDDLARAAVEVEIDAASIDTNNGDRDAHLRSADFFDTERFPALRFRSTAVEARGDEHYVVRGELTIRDVTREVELEVEHSGRGLDQWGNERLAFSARTSIDRRDFGLRWNQLLEAGGVAVGERVGIELDVQVVKAAATAAA